MTRHNLTFPLPLFDAGYLLIYSGDLAAAPGSSYSETPWSSAKMGTVGEAHRLAFGAIRRNSSKKLKMKTTLFSFGIV